MLPLEESLGNVEKLNLRMSWSRSQKAPITRKLVYRSADSKIGHSYRFKKVFQRPGSWRKIIMHNRPKDGHNVRDLRCLICRKSTSKSYTYQIKRNILIFLIYFNEINEPKIMWSSVDKILSRIVENTMSSIYIYTGVL